MKTSISTSDVSERSRIVRSSVQRQRRSKLLALAVLGLASTTLSTNAPAASIEDEQDSGKNESSTSAAQSPHPSPRESLEAIDRSEIDSMSTQHHAYTITGRQLLGHALQTQASQTSTLTREEKESRLARLLEERALYAARHSNYPSILPHYFDPNRNADGVAGTNISNAMPEQREVFVETEINVIPPEPSPRGATDLHQIADQASDLFASKVIRNEHFAFVELEGQTRRPQAAPNPLTPEAAALREERRSALEALIAAAAASGNNHIERAAVEEAPVREAPIERTQPNILAEPIRAALLAIPLAQQAQVVAGCGGGGGGGIGGALGGGIGGPGGGRGFDFGLGGADLGGGGLGVAGAGVAPGIGDQINHYKLLITAVGLYTAYQVTAQTEIGAALIEGVSNLWEKALELGWDTSDEVAPSPSEAQDHEPTIDETTPVTTSAPIPVPATSPKLAVVSPEDGDWLRFFLPNTPSDEMTSPSQISQEMQTPTVNDEHSESSTAVAIIPVPSKNGMAIESEVKPQQPETGPSLNSEASVPLAELEIASEIVSEVIPEAGAKDVPGPALTPQSETEIQLEPELSSPETTDENVEASVENVEASDIEHIDTLEPEETFVDMLKTAPLPEKVAVRPAAGAYNSNAWAANTMFQIRLSDRLGSYAPVEAGQHQGKAWVRYSGSRNQLQDDSGEIRTKGDKNAILMGFDMLGASSSSGDQTTLGLMGGYGHYRGQSRSSKVDDKSSGMVNGHSIGLYSTYQRDTIAQQGLYLDGWALWNRFDQTVKGGDRPSEKYTSKGVTASLELGYNVKLAERGNVKYMLQPHSQFIYQNVRAPDFREADGTRISFLNGPRVQTVVGLRAAAHVLNNSIYVITPHIDVNWLHTSRGYGVRIDDAESTMSAGRNVGQIKIGVQGELGRHVSLNIELVHQQGNGRYHETGGNLTATVRY